MSTQVFAFDAYGTLFDTHAAIARHEAAIGPEASRVSEIWRSKQLEYSWTLALAGRYLDFWVLTQRALDYALERCPTVDKGLRPQLLAAYFTLDAYADARSTVEQLKAQGYRTAILSNGSPKMLAAAVERAGLGPALDAVLSVEAAGTFKPRPEGYALLTRTFAVGSGAVTLVSSNRWDIMGAAAFGFRAIWINRSASPDEYPEAPPAATLQALPGLLASGA